MCKTMKFTYGGYFTFSFNIYLLGTCHVEGMVFYAEKTVINKAKSPDFVEFSLLVTNSLILSA